MAQNQSLKGSNRKLKQLERSLDNKVDLVITNSESNLAVKRQKELEKKYEINKLKKKNISQIFKANFDAELKKFGTKYIE